MAMIPSMSLLRSGWTPIVEAAATCIAHARAVRRGVDSRRHRLLIEVDEPDGDVVRGVVAAADAVSGEICGGCGHPLVRIEPAVVGCLDCRGAVAVERPPWRRDRDVDAERRDGPTLEDVLGDRLDDLMNGRSAPTAAAGWPAERGWHHLVRAALTLLLPEQCPGTSDPWRLAQLKESHGALRIYHPGRPDLGRRYEPGTAAARAVAFRRGVIQLVEVLSQMTCIRCGAPGELRWAAWVRPECDVCWARAPAAEHERHAERRERMEVDLAVVSGRRVRVV